MAQVANTAQGGGTARTNKKLQPNVLRRVMTPKTSYSEIMPQLPAPAASSGQDLQQAIQAAQRGETVRPAEWAQYESGIDAWNKEVEQTVSQAVKDSEARDGVWQDPGIYEDYRRQQDESIEGLQNRSMQLRAFFDTHRDVYGSEQVDKLLSAMDQNSKRLNGVKTFLDEEGTFRGQFADEGEYNDYTRLSAYEKLRSAPDFAEKSRYSSTANGKRAVFDPYSRQYTQTGYDDPLYDYINRDPTAMTVLATNEINNGSAAMGRGSDPYEFMDDSQTALFNYLYATKGKDSAYDYLSLLRSNLNAKQRTQLQQDAAEFAQKYKGLASVASILESPARGLAYIGQAADYIGDGKIDPNAGYNRYSYIPSTIRAQRSQDIENGWAGSAGSFLYNTGMSMGDFLLNAAITGGGSAGLGLMGAGAAADTVLDKKAQGYDDTRSFVLGTVAGLAEVATEKFSLDALLDKTSLGRSAFGYFMKNVIAEGSEEGASDLINWAADELYDVLTSQSDSEWKRAVREKGTKAAFWDRAKELGLDVLGGALSGGVMSGANIAANRLLYRNAAPQTDTRSPAQMEDLTAPVQMQDLTAPDPLAQTAREMAMEAIQEPSEAPAAPAMQEPAPVQQGPAEATQRSGGPYSGYSLDELFAQLPDSDAPQMQSAADVGRDGLVFDSVGDGRSPQETIAPARRSTDTNRATGGGPSRPALQQLAQDFGQAGRQAFAEAWDGRDSAQYYAGFAAWYQAGLEGKAADQVRSPYAGNISMEGRQIAYNAGQMDAALSLEQEKAAAPYAKSAGAEAGLRYADSVQAAIDAGETVFTPEEVERIDAAARAFGVNVYVVDSIEQSRANGKYSGSDILLARDAQNPLQQVLGHELTHRLQELAPEQFRTFRQAALDNMADSAVQAKLDRYHAQGEQLQYEQAMNDVAADYAGQLLEDGQLLDQFIERHREDRTLLQKLRDVFRGLWEKLTGAERRRAQSAEGKLSAVLDAAATQAQNLIEASPASVDVEGTEGTMNQDGAPSRRALQTDVPEGQGAEGKALYSLKEYTDSGKKLPTYEELIKKPDIRIVDIRGERTGRFSEQRKNFLNSDRVKQFYAEPVINKDTGEAMFITPRTITHTFSNLGMDQVALAEHLPEVIQEAVLTYGEPSRKAPGDKSTGVFTLFGAVRADNGVLPVKLTVKEYNIKGQDIPQTIKEYLGTGLQPQTYAGVYDGKVLVLESVEKEEASSSATTDAAQSAAVSYPSASSDISVKDLLALVKGDAKKYVPVGDTTQYSLKDTTITKTYNQLLRENDALRERVDYWRGQTRTTKEVTTDKKSVTAAAKALVKEYGAQLDTKELTGRLQALYDHMARTLYDKRETEGSDVWKGAEEIARDIAESSVEEWSLAQEFPGLREKLRDTSITVGHEYDGDIRNENFRRDYRGKLKLSAQGPTNVDAVYAELSESYPGLFPEDITHPADQLEQIMEVADSLATVEQQRRFSGQMDEAVMGITNEIVEQFLDMPLTRATFADEQAAKLDKLRQENREAVQNAIAKEQLARESQVKELKSKYKARTEAGRERQKAGELRQKITRHAKKLSDKLLHPTDKAHIPEELRGPVARVLASLHTGSTYETYFDHKNAEYVKGKQGEVLGAEQTKRTQAFLELKQKYAEIAKNGGDMVIDADLLGSDAEGIQGSFDAVIAMGDTPIDTLNSRQLGTMWQVLKSVEHSVSTAGKLLNQGKYQRTAEWAGALAKDTANRRDSRSRRIGRSLENPYTFFSHFGQAGKDIYRTLRNAQDQQQLLTNRVADEVAKVVDEKTVKQLAKTTHRFTTEGGQELTLSTAQVMDILNLMGREQALNHLLVGGMVQPEVRAAKVRRGTESIRLTANDLADITGVLTAEQRKIAGGLQQIAATTLADMGNEASMTAYGYKKFTEPNYWPIRSARESLHSNIEKGGDNARSIKNIGMAKATVPHASNPVDVGSVFDTFARHTGDMVDYAAWLVPMEDLNRVYNYQYRDGEGNPTGKTVKGLLDAKGGEGSQKYWQDLMEDIQNGIKAKSDDPIVDLASRGVGAFKGAAVGGNIRVIIQQPTAFFRAGAVLNPADMILGLTKGATKGFGWQKAKQYSPIAMRKDAGGFDISAPGTMQETLFGGKNAVQKVNDLAGKPAGWADALTWGKLWNACEWQVARQHKELPKGSKAYYEEVNRVFTDMIDQTQVVDGILQRSNIMRTSNAMGQQATSFMGEPIMSLNLTMRAWDQLRNEQDPKKRGKAIKNFSRALTALTVTAAVNALAQSAIDAMRDDDRDKKYWERFRSAFTGQTGEEETPWEKAWAAVMEGNFGSNLNPAGQIPYVKDIQSLIQGYSVTRTELSVIEDLIENGKNFVKNADGHGGKTQAYALNRLLASAAKVFGLPVANLERDLWAAARSVATETGNLPLQYEMDKAIYNIGSEKNKSRFVDLMYKALESGELDTFETIQDDLMNVMGMDGAALESALKGKYTAKAKADPAYSIPQQSYDLLGIRPGGKSEKEEGFGPGDLDNEAYKDYAAQRAADYRQAEDALSGNPIFKGMDDETKDKILQAAFDMSKEWALEDASNGEYNTDKVWIADGRQAKKEGIDPWEFAIWNVTKNDTESMEEDGKEVKGQTRKDQLSDWLSDSSWLTDEQREFLWGTTYKDDYGDYRDDLAEYRAYGPQMDAAYSEMTESLADNPIFTGMDKETRDKVTDAAMSVAKQRAQAEVIDGFEYDAKWIEQTPEAEAMGIDAADYVLWHIVEDSTHSTRDEAGKEIKGQRKQDKLRDWMQEYDGLTYDQKYWLWRQEYPVAPMY